MLKLSSPSFPGLALAVVVMDLGTDLAKDGTFFCEGGQDEVARSVL